jgi:hypothetical protein
MKLLTVMFVAGVIDSVNEQSVTVEFAARPGCEPIVTVMQRSDFPCDIVEGDAFHMIKSKDDDETFVVCGNFEEHGEEL